MVEESIEELVGGAYFYGESRNSKSVPLWAHAKLSSMLDNSISKIVELFQTTTITNANIRRNKMLDKIFVEMEDSLWKELGIPFRFIGTDSTIAYTIPLSGPLPSAISPGKLDVVKFMEAARLSSCKSKGKCDFKDVDYKNISSDTDMKNYAELGNYMGVGYKLVMEAYGDKGIIVDPVNLHIKGLDKLKKKDKNVIIALNFKAMVERSLTVREIVGIIIHEVGHTFNDIQFGTTFAQTSLPALSSFADGKIQRGEDVRLAYKELTGNEATLTEATKRFPFEYAAHINTSIGRKSAFYNSEIMADQFASRFGYATELVTALDKFGTTHEREVYPITRMLAILILVALITMLIVALPLMILFSPQLLSVYLFLMPDILLPNVQDVVDEHEQSFSRARRLKLEMIRNLRTKGRGDANAYLDIILKLEVYMEEHEIDKATGSLLFTILRRNNEEIGFHELYQRLEQLSENDLYVMTAKLTTLNKKAIK